MSPRPPPDPKSLLGRHRLLSPTASIRVSPFCLGGMSFGTNWTAQMGECSKETVFDLLDTFYDLGGNFVDTANAYQDGQSEEWIGEWMKKTGRRDEFVISTKYAQGFKAHDHTVQQSNFGGTGTKSMYLSLEQSLKRLQTDYVDLFFVHYWDYATDIPELMQSLNTIFLQRKVLYFGISDAPAWVVVKANCYANAHGLRPFSVYQGRLSAQARDLESDIIPMCRDQRMGLVAWGVMGNGYFRSPDTSEEEGDRKTPFITTGREAQVSKALDTVAKRRKVSIYSVAIAYAMQKAPYIYPLIGGRFVAHLRANIEALGLTLYPQDIIDIEKGYDFNPGFPHNFIGVGGKAPQGPEDVLLLRDLGFFDYVSTEKAIHPKTESFHLPNGHAPAVGA
ncbi:hypothetical protein LTR84_008557 [Exophiala bonariae]|uniref:NADP-dependent oxidoreductase domain-containing protein n=1 Tax=Exophiala bonariae TaxID=1690606 RepID=A0AAV9N0C5_9EURO|nr:hypothetical protein LTR84_008557 [Exophiala bonariae]